jgi:SAM-dependent methyltransferase
LLVDARPVPHRYPRFDLLQVGWFRTVFMRRPLLLILRLLSVALFFLIIFSGLLGNQTPEDNFAPTFVWVIWWVGLAFLTALILSLLPPGAHILDAGCGSGRDSGAFLERGYEVTALDASEAMVKLASHHIGRPVLHMSFDQVQFREHFDGVWACASLLHVPRHSMAQVLEQPGMALKAGGVMYASFKYGEGEAVRDGRLFNDYDEGSLRDSLRNRPELEILKLWRTTDLRPHCSDVTWLNVLLRKC